MGAGAAGILSPAFALQLLADQLAGAADGFRLLASLLFGGFFVKLAPLHFAERAFALHLLLERAERLLDIVVADYDLNQGNTLLLNAKTPQGRVPPAGRDVVIIAAPGRSSARGERTYTKRGFGCPYCQGGGSRVFAAHETDK